MFENKTPKQILYYTTLIAIFVNVLWGTPFPLLKILYREMSIGSQDIGQNLTLISLRFFLAGIILLVLGVVRHAPLFKLTKRQVGLVCLLGISSTTVQYFFFNIGINNTSGIKASILGQVGIFFAIILTHFLDRNDSINRKKVLGLLFGFMGIVCINLEKGTQNFFSFSFLGEGFMMLSGLSSAISLFIAKKIGQELPPLVYTGWQLTIGSMLLFLVGIGLGGDPATLQFNALSVVLIIYLACVSSIACLLWYAILQYRKVGELALYKFVIPITGTLLTALLIPTEHLSVFHLLGLICVCLGIIIVNSKTIFIKKDCNTLS
jgi:drug/metabolite transporter (DMT)-like permease